ncbi:MAG: SagB/ThcOx family dehydrogenase [Bacteroidaceae bacterium]|jgi:nitroreductase|nr:SagB/ThcOx family dehydrogenase [Bacteroidaceae bacterium]MBQ8709309.1 SagB/ThcOx family dehydrogenase [Bacteroidaceae bacterium]MBR1492543.1 SagB/ThcOx family dehydrogenase [Bacteroidaceae bacterium]MBS7323051.1 SagB/ThcOx family dehydrogenase [Bacteroidaceae bacterium]MDY6256888.1 SagB/ThcOx family dehydrogenase [Bacteroidaceae bacterium]
MKKLSLVTTFLLMGISCFAQTTKLPTPDMKRQTISVMETYKQRKSVREYSAKALSEQDLSDLLWAAQGQNREDGHLTSPTAMNRQEIRLYVFTEKSVSLYDPQANTLTQVASGDHRGIMASGQDFVKNAPVVLLMVADMDKFRSNNQHAQWMVAVDTGIVCENINLFCSAAGLCTVPRGTMDSKAISTLLGLNDNQIPLINNPVGYPSK